MLESLPVTLIVGTVLGFLAGLGIGGGSLLLLWLTMVLGMEQGTAQGINLLFFLPAAAVSILLRCKHGSVDLKEISPAIIAGCLSAVLFSWLGMYVNIDLMRKLFGGLLILTGLRELFYKPKKKERP